MPQKVEFAGPIRLPDQQFCLAEVEQIQLGDQWVAASGIVTLRVPAKVDLNLGDRAEIIGYARRPKKAEYPGSFDYRQYLASSRIYGSVWARYPIQVRKLPQQEYLPRMTDLLERFRQFARNKIQADVAPIDAQAGDALQALVLGYRSPAMQSIAQAFTDAGVAHLLAISGSHIVLVAGFVWLLLHPVTQRPKIRVLLMLLVVWLYVAATPAGPPILRAAIALTFFALASLATRPMQALNILAGALIICLWLRPADIGDAGLQLSFATTAGLILIAPRLHDALLLGWYERNAMITRAIGTRPAFWWLRVRFSVLLAELTNITGALISAPLVAYHFAQVNPLAVVSGLVAMPVVSACLIVGLCHLIVSAMGMSFLAAPAAWCAQMMNDLIIWLSRIPGSAVAIRPLPLWLVVVFFVVIILVMLRRQLRFSRASALLMILAAMAGVMTWYMLTAPTGTKLWVLGRSVIMHDDQQTVVINPGSERFALHHVDQFLRRKGIRHIDSLLLSHADDRHAGGAAYLARRYRIPYVYLSQQAELSRHHKWQIGVWLEQLEHLGVTPVPLAAGDALTTPLLQANVIWPPRRDVPVMTPAQGALICNIHLNGADLLLIPDAFPQSWPKSLLKPDSASAIILASGDKSPIPDVMTFCGDDHFYAYDIRDGQLMPIAPAK